MDKNLFTLTLIKGIDILDCFSDDRQEMGIKDISKVIGMPESSVHRIIQTLEYTGMIIQNRENKKYRLGIKSIRTFGKLGSLSKCKDVAVLYINEINQKCGETVNLGIREGDKIVYLSKADAKHLLRPNFVIGDKYSIHNTSLGKVLLTDVNVQTLEWIYDKNKEEIFCSFEEFRNKIEEVKKTGYAKDEEEFQAGICCVAAPIKALGGRVLMAVSISVPTVRLNKEKYEEMRELVVSYAEIISQGVQKML